MSAMEHENPTRPASLQPGVGVTVEVGIDRMVAGGLGLGHDADGRVVLVEGALPGERVRAELTESKPRMARGFVAEMLTAAPDRVTPPCPEVSAGCGGCDLQFAPPTRQWSLKTAIVADALQRIGRLGGVPIVLGRRLPSEAYRTSLRCGVLDGRAGFRRRRSSQIHPVATCLIAHPLLAEVIQHGRFPDADEVSIRAGARTRERLVLVGPSVGATTLDGLSIPGDVVVVGDDELRAGGAAWFHEVVAGRRFRISARSFFQARPDGAEALVDAVARAIAPFDPASDRLVDLYGGVGLFTSALGAENAELVERSSSSIADARVNLEDLRTRITRTAVEKWRPSPADVVVADPARGGLGAAGAAAVIATGAERVALVSCDPASLARDARLLVDGGYEVLGVEVIDLFPHTHHVEAVTTLRRVGRVG